jgi:hypothetical protein
MKHIGKGYYYNVFAISPERVRKIEKGALQTFIDLWRYEGNRPLQIFKTFRNISNNKKNMRSLYGSVTENTNTELLGNPTFFENITYEQDRVTILGDCLENISNDEGKKLIDQYVGSIIECWRGGFSVVVFNFTINNGVNKKGKVILIDFNDVIFSKNKVSEMILSERWLEAWSFKRLPEMYQQYYKKEMERRITLEMLEANWCKNCK